MGLLFSRPLRSPFIRIVRNNPRNNCFPSENLYGIEAAEISYHHWENFPEIFISFQSTTRNVLNMIPIYDIFSPSKIFLLKKEVFRKSFFNRRQKRIIIGRSMFTREKISLENASWMERCATTKLMSLTTEPVSYEMREETKLFTRFHSMRYRLHKSVDML